MKTATITATKTYNLNARQVTNNGLPPLWSIFDGNVCVKLRGHNNIFASRAECRAAIEAFNRDADMRENFGL